tara:strand:+ start:1088 stop:2017 length:930 start_codon:yes stop_codon:yes gene_type:complete
MKSFFLIFNAFIFMSCSSGEKKKVEFIGKEPSSIEVYSEKKLDQLSESDFSVDPRYKYQNEKFSKKGMSFIQSESMLRLDYEDFKQISSISGPLTKSLRECVSGNKLKAYKYFDYLYKYYAQKSNYWVYRGNCSFHLGELERSVRFYLKAKELGAPESLVSNNLAVVYLKKGNVLKAKKILFSKGASSTRSNSILFNRALILSSFGLYEKSQKILSKILEKNFSDNDVLFLAGKNYLNLGDPNSALSYLERIDKNLFSKFDFGFLMARAFFESHQHSKAEVILGRVVAKSKEDKHSIMLLRNKYIKGSK